MLAESIQKSRDTATRLVTCARARAIAKADTAAALASNPSETGDGTRRLSCTHATEQLAAFRDWVFAVVSRISARVAGQRICVAHAPTGPRTSKADADRLEPLDAHPLLDMLARPGPPVKTQTALMTITVALMELTGRSLWWVPEDNGRRRVLPIPTPWISEITATHWHIRRPGWAKAIPLPVDACAEFKYIDPADPFGALSPLQQLAGAVDLDRAIVDSQVAAFRNSLHPGLALKIGKNPDIAGMPPGQRPTLTAPQRRQLIEAVKGAVSGVFKRGEPLILDGLIENVFPIYSKPLEMDYGASSDAVKARICQGYGMSPILLGEIQGANRASAVAADEIFLAAKINPLLRLLSEAMTTELGPMYGGGLRVWVEPAVAKDADVQHKRWALASARGSVTHNELRKHLLNIGSTPGGDVLIGGGGAPPAVGPEEKAFLELVRGIDPFTCKAIAK